ncbi:MAG: hypothetical protein K0S54_2932 [Alphaproteobacteria bacterium]|nr:hypothetical protein [Alphaproteobacteria bacterium]
MIPGEFLTFLDKRAQFCAASFHFRRTVRLATIQSFLKCACYGLSNGFAMLARDLPGQLFSARIFDA